LEGFETITEGGDSSAARHVPIVIEPTESPKQRALIIEGAALTHLMGSQVQDEMLFAVLSCFDSVIACRVSPKQKALLVRTVRTYVEPEPMTLAIGDGANDVGMIQEAHVGVGISGLEGCQAVNASDFAIAQFRFLEDLLLIHGRYNFNRMARVVLYSFYKNAVLATLLVVYSLQNLFSGTTLFDSWLISMFNFVCFFPIFFVGLFDRDVDKDYVRLNPQLYAAGHHAEEMSLRKVIRWVVTTIVHLVIIYYLSIPVLNNGGTMSSAFSGLLRNKNKWVPGDGEGDYQSDGTAIYTVLVVTLAYKVCLLQVLFIEIISRHRIKCTDVNLTYILSSFNRRFTRQNRFIMEFAQPVIVA
jgi:magnesium-transporting ATPase (P-type)